LCDSGDFGDSGVYGDIYNSSVAPIDDARWMEVALAEAARAEQLGEVPVGAVVVRDGALLARGHNRNLLDHDPTAHAEIVALREAGRVTGNHRLLECDLYCIIEPCAMCAGAMVHARIRRLIYGAADPKAGAAGSVLDVLGDARLNHQVTVVPGVLADRCGELLQTFFRRRRNEK
jgi:tRNA(adenine34) deaminase